MVMLRLIPKHLFEYVVLKRKSVGYLAEMAPRIFLIVIV